MIHQVIYCSTAVRAFSENHLMALLEKARDKNFRLGITGMLVYEDGAFLQVIEGPKESIEQLLVTLQNDPRHHKFRVLSFKTIATREFGCWEMAFFRRNDRVSCPDGYVDFASIREEFTIDSSMATQMLTLFQEGLFRDATESPGESVGSCTVTIRSKLSDSDRKRRRYVVELGRAMAVSLPDVPVIAITGQDKITFNQLRDLDCGEIEMF